MKKSENKIVGARPIFKKLLIAAIVIYVIGCCMIQADLYRKVIEVEHQLMCGHH